MKYLALGIALLMCVSTAQAYLTAAVKASPHDEPPAVLAVEIESDGTVLHIGSSLDDTNRDSYYLACQYDSSGDPNVVSILGWKGMFAALPYSTIASSSDIISATLRLCQRGPNGDEQFTINRITTPWLLSGAGSNEGIVTGTRRAAGGEDPYWAGGESVGFSSADYTTTNQATLTLTEYNYNKPIFVDVTALVRDMYDNGNQGFVIVQTAGSWDPWFQGDEQTQMGDDGFYAKPTLYITYVPEPATIGLLAFGGIAALLRKRR